MLSRDSILAAKDFETETVEVPEWGGSVCVRMMSGRERDRFEADQRRDPYRDIRARLAAATLCDEAGALLFTPADIEALAAKSSKALDRVFDAAVRINKLSAADVEDLAKN